jgi:repressor of nif and glnA expression
MTDHKQMKKQAILHVLKRSGKSLKSALITEALAKRGYEMSERTVRLYLQELDGEGLTDNKGKRGRLITEKGLAELSSSQTLERVGFLSARIDQMTYKMSFDLARRTGSVVVNTTLVTRDQILPCLDDIYKVFEKGYAMGTLTALLKPGETVGDLVVPDGMLGFCSVCSITLNGVLLKHGVPTRSRFGGLMEMRDHRPVRFSEMITYDGTSIDPLEIFIRSAMTDYLGAVTTGNGTIGASFREIPADSYDLVADLADKLDSVGLGGFMAIGQPGQPLFDIPVSDGRAGAVVIGGLNPVAILEEMGIRVFSRALAGLLDFNKLFHYEELGSRL